MTERKFWDDARPGLIAAAREAGRPLLLQRIEAPTTAGIPDVWYATSRAAGWLELKILRDRRARPTVRPAQLRWAAAARAIGVPVLLAARSQLTGYVFVWRDPRAAAERGVAAADFRFAVPTPWADLLEVLEGGP